MLLRNKRLLVTFLLALMGINPAYAVCYDNHIRTTPTTDFIVHHDGTATHKTTSLMWMRCPVGYDYDAENTACNETSNDITFYWRGALDAAKNLNANGGYGNYTDWRVPNVKELASIVEHGCDQFYNPDVFIVGIPSSTFTSSPASGVYDSNGVYLPATTGQVYAVRGGEMVTVDRQTATNPFVSLLLVRDVQN